MPPERAPKCSRDDQLFMGRVLHAAADAGVAGRGPTKHLHSFIWLKNVLVAGLVKAVVY